MSTKETITMTLREAERLETINNLISKSITGTEAGKQLGLSLRQTKRLKAKVKQLGFQGVIHGNRGKKSNNKLGEKVLARIKSLLKNKYHYLNPLLAKEHLEEDDRIAISKETVRQIMIKQGLWNPKDRKQPQYFSLRGRKDNYGEMEQFDGCYHHWFYGINEEQCLLVSVDDATGKVTKAKFGLSEGVIPVFTFWKEYILEHGKPLSIYLDKFSTYKVNHKHAEDNKDLMTQFQRAMKEMGPRIINANTPQAKGRVERMNQTFQNRLVKELRLRGIKTIPEANEFLEKEFLPRFNAKFAVVPKSKTDLHKKIGKDVNLDEIFCIQKQRVIGNDYVVRYENTYYQLDEIQPTTVYKKSIVIVETKIDGQVLIKQGKHHLSFVVLPERPKREIEVVLPALTQRKNDWIPPANHPWKAASFRRRQAITNARV